MSLFWIETGTPLRVAIVLRPRGGDWLEDELARMKLDGVDILVPMLTSSEISELGLADEARLSRQTGIEFHNFAIPDRETPESFALVSAFLTDLSPKLHQGRSLAVHCRASIGRSSLLLACLLCSDGMSHPLMPSPELLRHVARRFPTRPNRCAGWRGLPRRFPHINDEY